MSDEVGFRQIQRDAGESPPANDEEALANIRAIFPDATVIPFASKDERPDVCLPEMEPEPVPPQMQDGLTFVLGGSSDDPPIWGRGDDVAWVQGEPVGVVGPDGTGKSSLGQRLALALVEIIDREVLGMNVEPADRKVLYVAADRPKQAQRSVWRMVKDLDRVAFGKLRERLCAWKGPLPFDLVREPGKLAEFAGDWDASHVVLDSLGFIVPRLTEDETGSALAQAFTVCSVAGVEVAWLLHPRKANADNRKPNKLEDVYGSRWITAATGSILSLWGNAGDPVVEVRHLKPPRAEVGPFLMEIEHETRAVAVVEGTDLLGLLRAAPDGVSAKEAARFMDGASEKAREMKARRRLDSFVDRRLAYRREGRTIRGRIHEPDRYFTSPAGVRDDLKGRER